MHATLLVEAYLDNNPEDLARNWRALLGAHPLAEAENLIDEACRAHPRAQRRDYDVSRAVRHHLAWHFPQSINTAAGN